MARLQNTSLPYGEREGVAKAVIGKKVSAPITFERLTMTLESGLPEALRGGDTVIGKLPDGSGIAVIFPPTDREKLRALNRGDSIWVDGKVLKWDPFLDHLLVLLNV